MRRSASDERPWRRRSESGAEEAGMTKQVAERMDISRIRLSHKKTANAGLHS